MKIKKILLILKKKIIKSLILLFLKMFRKLSNLIHNHHQKLRI